ncbi:MAG: class I SAM-dependent methyltransferase, partial [Candidatus Tectomicrobia bacterium]|nr:class I SAM-dependent methyltransferase [Candidatus Tectomicrobia bacterium]
LQLMGSGRSRTLLDAGCGGGVFLPELSRRCEELIAFDMHDHLTRVRAMMRKEGIQGKLCRNSITHLPFAGNFFDRIVCVSVLEFVDDLPAAVAELHRCVKRGGSVLLGIPVVNPISKLGYRLARTPLPEDVHRWDWKQIIGCVSERFRLEGTRRFPRVCSPRYSLFMACRFVKA